MDNRTLDIDYLTDKKKKAIRAEMAKLHCMLQEHDCKLAYKGYCNDCSVLYRRLWELEIELRSRS